MQTVKKPQSLFCTAVTFARKTETQLTVQPQQAGKVQKGLEHIFQCGFHLVSYFSLLKLCKTLSVADNNLLYRTCQFGITFQESAYELGGELKSFWLPGVVLKLIFFWQHHL